MRDVEQDRFNCCEPCMYDRCQTVQEILALDGDFVCWTTVFTTLRTWVRDHHQGENIRTQRGQGPQGVQSTDFQVEKQRPAR